jgi:phosphatidylserine decarboxylase
MLARLFVTLQYLLPKHWLTAIVYRIARSRSPSVKDFLIRRFVQLYDVDVEEVRGDVPGDYASLNEFFIRELADDARPVDTDPRSVVSPVDGTISQAGPIAADTIWQAKGLHYSLDDLLATNLDNARTFIDGGFATIYLAPHNYHRVHSAFAGELEAVHYVPGDLFSVNAATVARIPGLFRRNERLILYFSTPLGRAVQVFVGALNVGSISTPWTGEVRPRKSGVVEMLELNDAPRMIDKGALLGWFNMGSTVIVLFPAGVCEWDEALVPGATVRMGEAIGKLQ